MHRHNKVDVCIASSCSNRTLTSAESIHYNTTPVKIENPFERINMELIEIKSMLKILLDREVKIKIRPD
jgi:hypothetical protein